MDEIIRVLIKRLVNKGMEITAIPAYMRDIANTIAATGTVIPGVLNRRLEMLGWNDIDLDEYTLELVTAVFEDDVEYQSPTCFKETFRLDGIDLPID